MSSAATDRLVDEIRSGRCVAFVGAGFSAPVCRRWGDLLTAVAGELEDGGVRGQIEALLATGGGRSYEIAAQLLEDAFARHDTRPLLDVVRALTRKADPAPAEEERMRRRRELLLGIPFAAVLTTNFDGELRGPVLDAETYALLLREADRRWVETRFWRKMGAGPVLKLHGDLRGDRGITLSRRGYRARLYAEPGYLHALRSVFLTKTMLFLGTSLQDEYLNELRSEALAYLGPHASARPLAYAVLPDTPEVICAHYAKHEGVHVLAYDSRGGVEHGYLDELLGELHARTHPARVMGPRLRGKRILWVDPNDHHNTKGRAYLEEAAEGLCAIELASSPEDAAARLASAAYDLVITRWGHRADGEADAVRLLSLVRRADVRAPVVVFASRAHADANREVALRLGALEYTSSWEVLFEVIDRRFGPPPE